MTIPTGRKIDCHIHAIDPVRFPFAADTPYRPSGQEIAPVDSTGPSLFTVDISGRNEQRVPTPGFASDPAWSPLLS